MRDWLNIPSVRFLLAVLAMLPACAIAHGQHPPLLDLPPRAAGAITGSALATQLQGRTVNAREAILWRELSAGNMPSHLRELQPVTATAVIQGQLRSVTFWCMPDYVGVGSGSDWLRMPITPGLAQQLCDQLDCVLPTRRMVDAIWQAAPLKLQPYPFSPSVFSITSVSVFYLQHQQIELQRMGQPPTLMTAGIKKDIVASSLIANWPGRVCIYGWHYPSGAPIQPLSKVHTSSYVDYSHGARLVARRCEVDGVATTVDEILADPVLHPLLSDEAVFSSYRYPPATFEGLPLHETFPASGPQRSDWRAKFTTPTSVITAPAPTSGDATVLRIMDPAGGTDSLRIDLGSVRDVACHADLLCEHRPQLAANGFERIGVFVRDRATGAFDGTLNQQGACYALTWDSHDGRLRCLRAASGVLTDLLPTPRYVTGTAWRRFRVEAIGSTLQFHLDGELLLATSDTTHANGAFGIGYHEFFATNSNMLGARVDACYAEVPGALSLRLAPGISPGRIDLRRRRGVPGDAFFTAVTFAPGAFPNGGFFGLDIAIPDLASQLLSGLPAFAGVLDANGAHDLAVSGLPLGLPLQSVAFTFDSTFRLLTVASPMRVTVR
jgi:hypothetical protein